jgi:hypothetical protein
MSKVQLQGNVSGTGIFTIASPNSNTDRTLTLPDSSGTIGLSGAAVTRSQMPAGSIIQVVQNISNTEYNIGAGGTGGAFTAWTQLTNYSVTITPTSSSNKILLMATIPWFGGANVATTVDVQALFYRNTTQLNGGQPIATAYIANNTYLVAPLQFLDSPATTSSITYYIYGRGRYASTGDYSYNRGGNGSTVITAMEVVA